MYKIIVFRIPCYTMLETPLLIGPKDNLNFDSLPLIVFIRMHPNLVFLWYKGRNFGAITGDYQLAAPVNFMRGILVSGNWTPLDLFDIMLVD